MRRKANIQSFLSTNGQDHGDAMDAVVCRSCMAFPTYRLTETNVNKNARQLVGFGETRTAQAVNRSDLQLEWCALGTT